MKKILVISLGLPMVATLVSAPATAADAIRFKVSKAAPDGWPAKTAVDARLTYGSCVQPPADTFSFEEASAVAPVAIAGKRVVLGGAAAGNRAVPVNPSEDNAISDDNNLNYCCQLDSVPCSVEPGIYASGDTIMINSYWVETVPDTPDWVVLFTAGIKPNGRPTIKLFDNEPMGFGPLAAGTYTFCIGYTLGPIPEGAVRVSPIQTGYGVVSDGGSLSPAPYNYFSVVAGESDLYFLDDVNFDNGDEAFTAGCHLSYSDAQCTMDKAVYSGDQCEPNGMDLLEWTNKECHPLHPLDVKRHYCDAECRAMGHDDGHCETVANHCGAGIDSARCVCTDKGPGFPLCFKWTAFCDGVQVNSPGPGGASWYHWDCANNSPMDAEIGGNWLSNCPTPDNGPGLLRSSAPNGPGDWYFTVDFPFDGNVDMHQGVYSNGTCWIDNLEYTLQMGACTGIKGATRSSVK